MEVAGDMEVTGDVVVSQVIFLPLKPEAFSLLILLCNILLNELPGVLWIYRTTVRTPTGETLFKLAYGSEAIIPAEVHMANHRVMKYQDKDNEEQLYLNVDLIDEVRMDAKQRTTRYKNLMAKQYDAMVKPRCFNIGDLILKKGLFGNQKPS
ncbi:uncharacterized protein LOC115974551 [Quercus lobata]|uniref:uncharacterized protein LOC115974551 n=1 Tax=Quercus lobata TaxID=97700 RepID=UPI00124539F9|nr:uncharacterized protein LOC115974551 [Quercus lobata]